MRLPIKIVVLKKQEVLHKLSSCLSLHLSSMQTHLPYFIVICGLTSSTTFFHVISGKVQFS